MFIIQTNHQEFLDETTGSLRVELNKEKQSIIERKLKEEEQIPSFEDKLHHLDKLKTRLEQSLNEGEDSWAREKLKRPAESDPDILVPSQTPGNKLCIKFRLLEGGRAQIIEVNVVFNFNFISVFFYILYSSQADSCIENVPGRWRKCRESVKTYEEYYEGDEDVEKEDKRRKKTGGYNLPGEKLVCNFCHMRYLTKISLQVRIGCKISR